MELRGILASGHAISEAKLGPHYEKARAEQGEEQLYVELEWDVLLIPQEDRILPRSRLDEQDLSDVCWNTRGSGVSMPEGVASHLEIVWAEHLAQIGYPNRPRPLAEKFQTNWQPCEPFQFTWPPGNTENYTIAFETDVTLRSGTYHFVVGCTTRPSAGMDDRQRAVVFLGQPPRLIPLVEFSGANDYAQTGLLASLIKDTNNKRPRTEAEIPSDYKGMRTDIYRNIVQGRSASQTLAVVAHKDDYDLMLHHAIIRARYKKKI
jgi:hypothetical protein